MTLLVGIDEAGYGPLLGPLVVSGVAWCVPNCDGETPCLWAKLRNACSKAPAEASKRLIVADSKLAYGSKGGLAVLERTVLAGVELLGQESDRFFRLVEGLSSRNVLDDIASYPWYGDGDIPLPIDATTGNVRLRANGWRAACKDAGVTLEQVQCQILPEGTFNELVHRTRNKASVLVAAVMKLVDGALRCADSRDERHIVVHVDRLGGRSHYRDTLMTCFPDWSLMVLAEEDKISEYRLTQGSRTCDIRFATGGEERSFVTALASMYSKYLRELLMHRFNQYWCARLPGLKPTAGYYSDGKRWLQDADSAIRQACVDTGRLIRCR